MKWRERSEFQIPHEFFFGQKEKVGVVVVPFLAPCLYLSQTNQNEERKLDIIVNFLLRS